MSDRTRNRVEDYGKKNSHWHWDRSHVGLSADIMNWIKDTKLLINS